MPTIEGNEIERENAEEPQWSTREAQVRCLDVAFKGSGGSSKGMLLLVIYEPGLYWAFILQLRQRNCSIWHTELSARIRSRNQRTVFSSLQCKNKNLHTLSDLLRQ